MSIETQEYRTGLEWQKIFPSIAIHDPDGWRYPDRFWDKEFITEEEYKKRRAECTCNFKHVTEFCKNGLTPDEAIKAVDDRDREYWSNTL
jgi:hypothetical protein